MVAIAGATIAELIIVVVAVVVVLLLARSSVRMVRPTHRALIERLGKYNRYAGPGIHGVVPIIERCTRSTCARSWSKPSLRRSSPTTT